MRDKTNDDGEWKWSRRRTLEAAGTVGIASLAGCAGTSSNDSQNSNGNGQPTDPELTLSEWLVPKDAQYNSFNSKNWPGDASRMLYDAFVRYNAKKNEFEPNLLTDWSIDGKTVTLKTRKQQWHDGDSVTADDLVAQLRLEKFMGMTKFLESAEVTGDQSAKLTLTSEINPDVFLETFRNKRLTVKKSLFEKHLQEFESASSDSEKSTAQSNLSSRTIEEPIGNGPFELKTATSQQFTLTKFEKHPQAGNINFPRVVYKYFPSNQKRWQALMNNELDGQAQMFVPKNVREKFPKSVVRAKIPTNSGFGVTFQHDHKHFGQRNVRQAVAHVIDREQVAQNSGGDTKVPVDLPSAVPANTDEWLGNSAGKFNKYQTSTQKAASLLKDAGFERQSGTWVDSNGNTLKAPFKVPSGYTDWVTASETIVSQLQSFGIDAKLVSRSTSTFWGKDFAKGNFVLAAGGWSARLHSHPYFHLKFQLDSSAADNVYNYPDTVSVPSLNGSGGGSQEVDVAKEVESLLTAKPGKKTKQRVQKLAWVVNQTLPVLPIQEKLAQSFVTKDDWNVPSQNSKSMSVYWPTSWLPRTGELTAKTK
ncbi:ABC transporter substrate-binding protein [Halomicrococcus sp. SG-WS-1]|uniref:ABC transporter substrate-binding protein n=1 Tax=Halomicrococcus sp. SG-WS-1 TaxID=3439057 RepID=UPI003F7AA630